MAHEVLAASRSLPARPLHRPVNRTAERVFFAVMVLLVWAAVLIGFWPTYFGAGVFDAPLPSPILPWHGAVFTLWLVLLLVQSVLVSAGRVKLHRTLGTVFFCLPPLMVVLGVIAALDALHRGVRIGPLDPAVTLAIPLFDIVGFSVVIYAAWSTRRRPDAHKRLVMLATIGLTYAAFGRFPWERMGISPAAGGVMGIGALILLMVAYDLISLHRIHRATMWAAPFTFVINAFSVPIGQTAAWHGFVALLGRTVAAHL